MTDNVEVVSRLERTNELLAAILKALSSDVLKEELKNEKLKKLYGMTGQAPVKELAAKVGMGVGPISETWQRWESLGLLVKDGKSYRRLF